MPDATPPPHSPAPFWSTPSGAPQTLPTASPPQGPWPYQQQHGSSAPPTSGTVLALTIVMWIVWVVVVLLADFLGFMMFAFADSPGAGRAAQMMIVPAFLWFGFTFVAGAVLLYFRRWWTIALAFVLAVSPPFVIFAGYNVLDGVGTTATLNPGGGSPINPPPVNAKMPEGGFKPPPLVSQPDSEGFRRSIEKYTSSRPSPPTTQP